VISAAKSFSAVLRSEADTVRLAQIIARRLHPVDCIALTGNLGAGKTCFTRALIQFLQPPDAPEVTVISPSFLLMQEYQVQLQEGKYAGQQAVLWHLDGYRLESEAEIPELGLDELLESAIVVMEWAERFAGFLPLNRLEITLETVENTIRKVTITGKGKHEHSIHTIDKEFHAKP
jgi:tRNA threonylcarbamoyl adenosine modification protein YjeE